MALYRNAFCNTFCTSGTCFPQISMFNVETQPLTPQTIDRLSVRIELINAISGTHLKIATFDNPPMSWVEKGDDGKLVGRGVAFRVLNMLQKKFNFTYDIVLPEQNFEMGGNRPEDSIIGLLNNSLVDMAAIFLPKHELYQKHVWFSHDLDEGVWRMMLKRPHDSAARSRLLAPFSRQVSNCIMAAALLFGPCITLFTRLRSRLIPDDEKPISLSSSTWFVYEAFLKQGSNLDPKSNTTRVLFTTWWIFILILSAFYSANLTAFLTLSKFSLEIKTPRDLYRKNHRWVAREGDSVQHTITNPHEKLFYLSRMLATGQGKFHKFNNSSEYLALVEDGAVLIREQLGLRLLILRDYRQKAAAGLPEEKRCSFVISPKIFMKKSRGFAYPKGSKLKPLFDRELSYLLQGGLINFRINQIQRSKSTCPFDLQSKDINLRITHLTSSYFIMVGGTFISTIVFIVELCLKLYSLKNKAIKSKKKKTKKTKFNKNSHIYHYDNSQPPSYDSIFRTTTVKAESVKKIVNGREYMVINLSNGGVRLIPLRTPSALLYPLELRE